MVKKLEITSEQVDAYVRLLKKREERYRADFKVAERGIKRTLDKLQHPERSLRADITEGVKSVSEATGFPLPARAKAAPARNEDENLDLPLDKKPDDEEFEEVPSPFNKKKSGWLSAYKTEEE